VITTLERSVASGDGATQKPTRMQQLRRMLATNAALVRDSFAAARAYEDCRTDEARRDVLIRFAGGIRN
jgi:hypothetical protein